ncbi:MAG: M28 family peptidase [Candidatus Neomarinimicrobiota bacterium]
MIDPIIDMVHYLASRECNGRRTGTAGSLAAREYIIDNMIKAGIHPGTANGFIHEFEGLPGGALGSNIIGVIPGRGALRDRFILVDAHYDHLGKDDQGLIYYPGADDNASAIASLLHAAKIFIDTEDNNNQDRRSLIITFCDAEEPPYFNSEHMGIEHFCKDFPEVIGRIDIAIILDMLGHRMGNGRVPEEFQEIFFIIGAEKSAVGPIVNSLKESVDDISPMRMGAHAIPPSGDYIPLYKYDLPYLFMTTGRFREYHTPYDTAEKLDYPKLERFSNYLAYLLTELAEAPLATFVYNRLGEDDLTTLETLQELFSRMKDDEQIPKNQSVFDHLQKRFIEGDVGKQSTKLDNIKDFLKQAHKQARRHGNLDHNERSKIKYLIDVVQKYMY